jgi:hypothetical protein
MKIRLAAFSIAIFAVLAFLLCVIQAHFAVANPGPAAAANGDSSPGWRIEKPASYQNLTIFPVVASQEADTEDFATLDQALASGDVVITEQGDYLRRTRDGHAPPQFSNGPQVNQLVLINRGKRPLLLLSGEVVSGGKQDRIIAKDRIVPPGAAPLPLDVFCVEHGRWTGASDQFASAKMMVHPSVRAEAAVKQDQRQVWAAVRGEAGAVVGSGNSAGIGTGVGAGIDAAPAPASVTPRDLSAAIASTGTQSYQKIYEASPIGASADAFAQEMQSRFERAISGLKGDHIVGVVAAFGDEVAWSDIFASSNLFNTYWPKLLRSYVVEAMTRPGVRHVASFDQARDFLRPATGHIEEESEPGVYIWRKQMQGRVAQIEIQALAPRNVTLHYLRVMQADQIAPSAVIVR